MSGRNILGAAPAAAASVDAGRRTVHVEHVMGTAVSLDLRGDGDHGSAIDAAVRWLHEVDARFSTYRTDSETSRWSRGELDAADASEDLRHVIATCAWIAGRSGGAFSADRGGRFDPSAYVKGWAVDRVAELLDEHGCDDWAANAGGDVRTRRPRGREPWRIGIRHPGDPDALAATIPAWDLAVATSGRYERGDHIDDPRSGRPADDAVSVTVTGPELGLADALATAAFVLGAGGPAWVATFPGHECWAAFPDGSVTATAGFPRFVLGTPVTVGRATDDARLGRTAAVRS